MNYFTTVRTYTSVFATQMRIRVRNFLDSIKKFYFLYFALCTIVLNSIILVFYFVNFPVEEFLNLLGKRQVERNENE